jgi:hypothetical protein
MSVNTFAFVSVPPQEACSYILYSDPDSDFSRSSCDRLDFAVQYLSGPESRGPIGAAGYYVQTKQRRARLSELQFHWIQHMLRRRARWVR